MLKKQIEAILLAFPEGLTINEICEHASCKEADAMDVLEDLDQEYDERSFDVTFSGNKWMIVMKPEVTHLVKKAAPSELSKAVQSTLGVIAYMNPAVQSDIVKIRGNKSYNHINELEEKEFIRTKQSGRTQKIWLTEKFYRYFDISPGEERYLFEQRGVKKRGVITNAQDEKSD